MEAPKRTVIRRRGGSAAAPSSRSDKKTTTAERQQGGAAQAQKAATSKLVKRDEHGVPIGPKLKYSVLVQHAEGVCEATLTSYFAQWGVVVSVKKVADSHGFVTFNSAASVVALLDLPPMHRVPTNGGKEGSQSASKKLRVLPRLVPTDPFWAEKEHQIEAALAQLEDPHFIKPAHLRFREDKRRPTVLRPGQAAEWAVELCNDGAQDRALSSVLLVPERQEFRLVKSYLYEDGAVLKRDSSLKFNIEFKPREHYRYGILRCLLIVSGRNFSLHHYIKVEVSHEDELKLLAPTAPYKPRVIDDVVRTIIPAFPPARASKSHLHTPVETSWVERLDEYPIPQNLQDDVAALGHSSSINPWLTRDNYRTRLHNLLWLEEAQGVVNMRKFDLTEINLEPLSFYEVNGRLVEVDEDDSPVCKLEIPGLAEGRPSVLANDIVYVWLPGTTDYEYEGFVHNVGKDHVLLNLCLDFHRSLADHPQQKYNVRFAFNRLMLRMQHRAVDKADIKLVWPEAAIDLRAVMQQQSKSNARAAASKSSAAHQVSDMSDHINWFDQRVSHNQEQALAVREVVKRNYGDKSQPMLLFGAYGTGKTRTLVEALKQIITLHPSDAKILICAPSNSAADVFVQHLAEFSGLDTTTLFRLYALHRPVGSVPISVVQFTSYSESAGLFLLPPLASLLKYNVIVTTAHTSSNLFGVGVKKGHFTHIILDEAAQMMEAEALIPLTLADERSVIIMAGDYRQLGPHLVSPSSKLHGLDKSIMERMANLPIYQSNQCLLELVKNYRSHPAILAYPSKCFYNGKLSAMAPPDEVNQLCGWKMLPNPKFPMLFYGVQGEDKQEGDSPSFFNPHEAIVVADLVMSLLKEKKLSEFDIGVISPFRKQIMKIRGLLRSRRVWNVRVDTVNEMQGKERKAIIISTVRASRDWKEHDRVHGVGFLSDVRRLNTAITRARCLLAVVGDPYVLYQDAHWRDLIQYCQSNNSYIGPEIRLDNFEAREKKEQQHKESQQLLKQQKQEEQKRQQLLQKQEEEKRQQQQQQHKLQLQLQLQQQQLEQQKRQSEQPLAKESHPTPAPAQNQHTQPKASAWQPLPVAVETQLATLSSAPTPTLGNRGNAPHSTPATLPATQNSAPFQLPPQGAHAPAAVHPWPWNGQPPQQHPLHPYYTALGQHQSMPVMFNPHSQLYFMPPAPHPSQLPAMPHHPLAHPPVPAPAAFQPPPTVHTASAPTPVSAPVVSAEESRANELLARQMMAPQPRPLPGIADESEAEEEQNEYAPLYSYEGQPLIMAKKTAPGYPAVMINERDGALVVKISLFGLSVAVQRNGQLIYVRLREAAEVKNALFTLPLLHAMPTANGKRSKKAPSGERAVLLVAVPQGFDPSRTKFEEGQTLLIITMVRPAHSTRLLTVTTTKTDLL